nr:MAG TPA: hypothetical protein [Caudoviricetes sp.]
MHSFHKWEERLSDALSITLTIMAKTSINIKPCLERGAQQTVSGISR